MTITSDLEGQECQGQGGAFTQEPIFNVVNILFLLIAYKCFVNLKDDLRTQHISYNNISYTIIFNTLQKNAYLK